MSKKRLSDEVIEGLHDERQLRQQRDYERTLATLRGKLARTEKQLKQAEGDLQERQQWNELLQELDQVEPVTIERRPHKPHGKATAIIVLSDWHVEEPVDPSTCNGLNTFNLSIAEKRIKTVFRKSVELIEAERSLSNIKDLVVACLGDFITGYIHEELVESNLLSPTEACLFVEEHLAGGLQLLHKESGCKSIIVPTCYGNHGRTTQKIRFATGHKNSFEWYMYHHLAKLMKLPGMTFKIENGYANILEVQGKVIRFTHGNTFKYKGGIAGPQVPILRWKAQADKAVTAWLDVFGHLHSWIQGEGIAGNPSLIGYGAASLYFRSGYCPPLQTLIVVDRDQPVPTLIKPIFCE